MSGERIAAESTGAVALADIVAHGVRGAPDVGAFASRGAKSVAVMVWHYHDDDVRGPAAAVSLDVRGLPASVRAATLTHYRIDALHSNAFDAWRRMGSPVAPNREQYAALEAASQLATLGAPQPVTVSNGVASLEFDLPRQGVSLVVLDWD